jgi:hypothetical protein
LSLNGHTGWRVPTLNQLASTANEGLVGGAIDRTAFPGNPNGCKDPKYWFRLDVRWRERHANRCEEPQRPYTLGIERNGVTGSSLRRARQCCL